MPSGRLPVAATILAVSILGCSSGSDHGPAGYWRGDLRAGELRWELGLEIERDGDSYRALLDVPSLWRGPMLPEAFETDGEKIAFELPWEMGRVEARHDGERIRGSADLGFDLRGSLDLVRASPPRLRMIDDHVVSSDVSIALTLALPEKAGPHPAVVVVHGGGDSERQSPPIRFWAHWLPRHGFACLIYDKRGCGETGGNWRDVGFDARARDVAALVDFLRSRPEIDPNAIGLLAVSQGTWLAAMVGAEDPDLAFIVQISGPVGSVYEADTWAEKIAARAAGLAPHEVAEYLHLWELDVAAVRQPEAEARWETLGSAVALARQRPWWSKLPYTLGTPEHWWTRWYHLVHAQDSRDYLPRVTAPMLWLYGDSDTQLDAATSVQRLEELRTGHDKPWSVRVFARAGHSLLHPVDGLGQPTAPLTIAPGFFETLLTWLQEQSVAALAEDPESPYL